MTQDFNEVRCPRCSAKLVVASDAENPFHQCGRCGAIFARYVERKPGKSENRPHYQPDDDPFEVHDPTFAPVPASRAFPRRRQSATLPLIGCLVFIGVMAMLVMGQRQVQRSLSRKAFPSGPLRIHQETWQGNHWQSAAVEVEQDDADGVRLKFRAGADPHTGLSILGLDPRVREVDLSGTTFNDAQLPLLLMSVNLHTLHLQDTQITDRGAKWLNRFKALRSLNLKGCSITDDSLNAIGRLSQLEELGLTGTLVTDEGMAHLQNLTGLKKLYLGDTPVGDEGMMHLSGLTNLEGLNLRNTQVGDEGLKHLRALPNLTYLYLAGTQVSDRGIEHFSAWNDLEGTNLFQTQVTASGIDRLESMLRQTVVVYKNP